MPELKSQISQGCLTPMWIDSWCFFREPLSLVSYSHWSHFIGVIFFSCILRLCLFKSFDETKDLSQTSHFISTILWNLLSCILRLPFLLVTKSHKGHWNLSLSWTAFRWCFRLASPLYCWLQSPHLSVIFKWTDSMCFFRMLLFGAK